MGWDVAALCTLSQGHLTSVKWLKDEKLAVI